MKALLAQVPSFDRRRPAADGQPVRHQPRLLHAHALPGRPPRPGRSGWPAWAVGLVLGVRNFSQQGMFLVGGTLADRFGYKPLIVAGCVLRTVGFALLGLVDTLPALIVASAATGLAGALFNPAVRAYLAAEARGAPGGGVRRCSTSSTRPASWSARWSDWPCWPADFRLVCPVAAVIFGLLDRVAGPSPARAPAAPSAVRNRRGGRWPRWRAIAANRPFLLFSVAMIGSYVLAFQVYLALPMRARELFGEPDRAGDQVLFAVSALAGRRRPAPADAMGQGRTSPGRAPSSGDWR